MRVAALYVDARGPYKGRDDVDAWDNTPNGFGELADARKYAGPWPVVAHPPCGAWSQHRRTYRGNDKDCGPRAVEQVRKFGGVLEHPAGSKLWEACGLPAACAWYAPGADQAWPDAFGGYTLEVAQVEYGHVARKRTWLYIVGVSAERARAILQPPFPGREPTHWCSGRRGTSSRGTATVPPGIKVCSAQQRNRTPPAFADALVALARAVTP
jgi:hypothetical protein